MKLFEDDCNWTVSKTDKFYTISDKKRDLSIKINKYKKPFRATNICIVCFGNDFGQVTSVLFERVLYPIGHVRARFICHDKNK